MNNIAGMVGQHSNFDTVTKQASFDCKSRGFVKQKSLQNWISFIHNYSIFVSDSVSLIFITMISVIFSLVFFLKYTQIFLLSTLFYISPYWTRSPWNKLFKLLDSVALLSIDVASSGWILALEWWLKRPLFSGLIIALCVPRRSSLILLLWHGAWGLTESNSFFWVTVNFSFRSLWTTVPMRRWLWI